MSFKLPVEIVTNAVESRAIVRAARDGDLGALRKLAERLDSDLARAQQVPRQSARSMTRFAEAS